ncbi:MAG: T9SS type A sorting domain-containing protein [Bacteroidota bacterium]
MKPFNKLLMATLAVVCLTQTLWAFQSPTLPYDLIIMGIDSDVNTNREDQIVLMSTREISDGYRFGIANALSDNSIWTTRHSSIEFINLKYKESDPIKKGTAITLLLHSTGLEIEIDNKSVTDLFEIELSSSYSGDFITSNQFYLSIYSGIMTRNGSDAILLGSTLDVVAYGITETQVRDIKLDSSVKDKEILLPPFNGTLATAMDRDNCDLCEILLLILFSENWLDISNSHGFDLDTINFDIKDCIQTDCPGDLVIDTLDCNTLTVVNLPCDSISFYQWSKIVDGQLVPVLTGDSAPIPNLELESSGIYQLHVTCTNGCRELSNRFETECFEGPCDFSIGISESNCVVSVSLSGCPNAEFQWFVQTDTDTYIIEGNNSSSIIADLDGTYYAKITGCPDCAETPSPSIDVNCGEDCMCEVNFYEQDCKLYFDTTGCNAYTSYLEYSKDNNDPWIYLGPQSSPYDPTEHGNGFYRFILTSQECIDLFEEVYVDCINTCTEVLIPSFTEDCNLVFNWEDCINPVFGLQYAQDCQNYASGGGELLSTTISPDGSGSAIFSSDYQVGCYQLLLNCNDECVVYSDKLELGDCCTSDLTIDTSNCSLSVSNIPCSGNFNYSVYADGKVVETGSNSTNFGVTIDQNAIYQVFIECDGCTYYSNTLKANCGSDSCTVNPLLSIDDCKLTAIVENCPNPIIQWQEEINGIWTDIPGETGSTYEIQEDGVFQYVLSGCNCTNEPLTSLPYTSNCFIDCNCNINFNLSETSCTIESSNPNCELISSIEWYLEDESGTWVHLSEFSGENTISPNLNGKYKKVVNTLDCGTEEAEIQVSCVNECENMDIQLGHVECTIPIFWSGCFDLDSWELLYSSSGSSFGCGASAPLAPDQYEIIAQSGSNITGEGFMEIKPLLDGCYTFILSCNDNCMDTISTNFTACCSPDAEIVLEESPGELCDYCYVNECTDSLLEIYVVIDEMTVSLSSFDEFNFPYCDNNNPGGCDSECIDMPNFDVLVDNINTWLGNYGYEGTAQEGNGPAACKGNSTTFWIEQTDIIFSTAFLWEHNNTHDYVVGYQVHPFIKSNCNGIPEDSLILKVINACIGADYLWSTGATSQYIEYHPGQSYTVTITCPDGCTDVLTYGSSGSGSRIAKDKNLIPKEQENVGLEQNKINQPLYAFRVFPVPTRESFSIEYLTHEKGGTTLFIFTGSGKLIKEVNLTSQIGKNIQVIDSSTLPNGIYFTKLVHKGINYGFQKVVIIH